MRSVWLLLMNSIDLGSISARSFQEKGTKPDLLSLTATPIPPNTGHYSLWEMDVSTIDGLPCWPQADRDHVAAQKSD